jgi:hypothetical protein
LEGSHDAQSGNGQVVVVGHRSHPVPGGRN